MKKLSEEVVRYLREHYKPGDAEFGIKAMAGRLGISMDAAKDALHGKTYKDVGGTIHPTYQGVSDEVKRALAAEYIPNSRDNSIKALAAKYGLSPATVIKYVHDDKPRRHRAVVTEEMRAAIRAEYDPTLSKEHRLNLAAKYGLSVATVNNILKDILEPSQRGRKPTVITDEVKEAIVLAHDDGLNLTALSERFGLNRLLIKNVLTEAGIKLRTRQVVAEDVKARVVEEFKAGRSIRELSNAFNINRATIAKWVEGLKPAKTRRELDPKTREQIYRYHSQGYGVGIIARTLGLGQQTVRKVIDGEL